MSARVAGPNAPRYPRTSRCRAEQRVDLLVVDQDVASLARLLPGSRRRGVGEPADGAQRVPEAEPAVVVDLVRLLEPGENLGARPWLAPELEQRVVNAVGQLRRLGADPRRHRDRRAEDAVVATRDEVHGSAHEHRPHRLLAQDRALERLPAEAHEPRPQPDIRRGRPLRLKAREPFQSLYHG